MPSYYITVPGMEKLAALVGAPDRRHARTTYLDFLARNKFISYGARQEYRRLLELDLARPEDEGAWSGLRLSYGNPNGVDSTPIEEEEVTSTPVENVPVEEPYYTDEGAGQFVDDVPLEEQPEAEAAPSFSPLSGQKPATGNPMGGGSPIMNLSRTSGGK